MLSLIQSISEKESLYIDIFDKKNLVEINKKISNKNKVAKILNFKYITSKSEYNTFTQLKPKI